MKYPLFIFLIVLLPFIYADSISIYTDTFTAADNTPLAQYNNWRCSENNSGTKVLNGMANIEQTAAGIYGDTCEHSFAQTVVTNGNQINYTIKLVNLVTQHILLGLCYNITDGKYYCGWDTSGGTFHWGYYFNFQQGNFFITYCDNHNYCSYMGPTYSSNPASNHIYSLIILNNGSQYVNAYDNGVLIRSFANNSLSNFSVVGVDGWGGSNTNTWDNLSVQKPAANNIPIINSMNMTPINAYRDNQLQCYFNYQHTDIGQTVYVNTTWFENTSNTVKHNISFEGGFKDPAQNINVYTNYTNGNFSGKLIYNSTYWCQATVSDQIDSVAQNSSATLILNNVPILNSLSIAPDPATVIDELQCLFNATDTDSMDTLNLSVTWYKNSSNNGSTIRIYNFDYNFTNISKDYLIATNLSKGNFSGILYVNDTLWCSVDLTDSLSHIFQNSSHIVINQASVNLSALYDPCDDEQSNTDLPCSLISNVQYPNHCKDATGNIYYFNGTLIENRVFYFYNNDFCFIDWNITGVGCYRVIANNGDVIKICIVQGQTGENMETINVLLLITTIIWIVFMVLAFTTRHRVVMIFNAFMTWIFMVVLGIYLFPLSGWAAGMIGSILFLLGLTFLVFSLRGKVTG